MKAVLAYATLCASHIGGLVGPKKPRKPARHKQPKPEIQIPEEAQLAFPFVLDD